MRTASWRALMVAVFLVPSAGCMQIAQRFSVGSGASGAGDTTWGLTIPIQVADQAIVPLEGSFSFSGSLQRYSTGIAWASIYGPDRLAPDRLWSTVIVNKGRVGTMLYAGGGLTYSVGNDPIDKNRAGAGPAESWWSPYVHAGAWLGGGPAAMVGLEVRYTFGSLLDSADPPRPDDIQVMFVFFGI